MRAEPIREQAQARPQIRARAQAASAPPPPTPSPELQGFTPAHTNLFGPGVVPVGSAPVRLPEGGMGGGAMMRSRSIFDEAVRGAGAQMQQVALRGAPSPIARMRLPGTAQLGRPLAQAGQGTPPPQAQDTTVVERVIQREMPPAGLTGPEAAAIANALGPAIEASAKAVAEGVVCGRVDALLVQEVRTIRDFLSRFAAVARSGERTERLSADDLAKIDEILACQATYAQMAGAEIGKTTALLIGGLIVGGVVLLAVSS